MRRASPLVGPQNNGNLRDARADLRRLDNHFQRKFHSRAAHVQPVVKSARKSAHAAIAVANARVKKSVEQRGEAGVAQVLVRRRHRSRLDSPAEAIAHHDVVAFPQLLDEARNVGEVVTIVRIAHDDKRAACSGNSGTQGRAVAAKPTTIASRSRPR